MSNNLLAIIKMAALEAVKADVPAGFVMGVVTSANPLKILVDQKFELTAAFLILTNAVKDHYRDMTVDHRTENAQGGSGDASYAAHNHPYVGRKSFLIHNDLVEGEKVVMARMQGGQKFIVLDRVAG